MQFKTQSWGWWSCKISLRRCMIVTYAWTTHDTLSVYRGAAQWQASQDNWWQCNLLVFQPTFSKTFPAKEYQQINCGLMLNLPSPILILDLISRRSVTFTIAFLNCSSLWQIYPTQTGKVCNEIQQYEKKEKNLENLTEIFCYWIA